MADATASTSKANQGKAAKARTIADIRSRKKPVTKKVAIQMDGEIANQIEELREMHDTARNNDRVSNEDEKAPAIQDQIDELLEQALESVEVFTFKSIGRYNYDKLVGQHPPTKDQKKQGMDFNPDTFPPVLVAASCIDPEIPLEDSEAIFADPNWNGAELRKLFFGALESNTEMGDIPLSRTGSDGIVNSLLNLATQQNMESPTPFS